MEEKKKPARQIRDMLKSVKFEQLRSLLILNTGSRPSTFMQFLRGTNVFIKCNPLLYSRCIAD